MNTNTIEDGNREESEFISINPNKDDLGWPCQFLSTNSENILFSLTCNYLSLGQFELARSSILQLSLFNFRKVSEILCSIIYYGPPPDWQLSVTIPTSTHFVLACIKEYESFLRKNTNIEGYITGRIEFDLLMVQMITDSFNININFESVKNLRYFYCSTFLMNSFDIKIPELKILPKIIGLPPYLSRFPSFSTNLNRFMKSLYIDETSDHENYFSIKIINEMFECFEISRSHFIQIAKMLIVNYTNKLKFEIGLLGSNSIVKSSLSIINRSLNWIVLKNCIRDLIFFKENHEISIHSLAKMVSKNMSILKLESLFENNDLIYTNVSNENNISLDQHIPEPTEPENVISIVVSIFCIINLFCKYDLSKEVFVDFLIDQSDILKNCESICDICVFESRFLSDINNLFSDNIFKQLNNFQHIYQYLTKYNIKLVEDVMYKDHIGELVDSNLDQNLMIKVVIMFDNFLFNINFGTNTHLGIFTLPKYIENKNKLILYPILDDFSIVYKLDENPIFWCEYLRYLNLSNNKFEELPIIFVSNLMKKICKGENNFLEVANKIILCFPHLRAVCIFLGMNDDPIFNWKLFKNLWLPFRLMHINDKTCIENRTLVCNLDEMSRRHAISIFISEVNSNNLVNELKCHSEKNTKTTFEEITLKKSIINYYYDNFMLNKKYTGINWKRMEEFISNVMSLPLTVGSDILLLTKERDCIKSYLVQKKVFEMIDEEENSSFGISLQNISFDIGNIQTSYFHNELMYCLLCHNFIYLKKNNINDLSISSENKIFFNITQLIYYLFIWSNRLSNDNEIEILPVISKIFKKAVLMIELILFSLPYNIPNNLPLSNNLTIFTWWYRFIISVPSKVFNNGKPLLSSNENSEYFQNMFHIRWTLRKTYENNPWYSDLLSFESYSVLNNYDRNWDRNNYSDILLSSSILALRLLSIQNYEKSIELITNSKLCTNITLIALDGFVFHALFEEATTFNHYNIITINSLIKNIDNEYLSNNDKLDINISLFSVLEKLFSFVVTKLFDCENEIGWLFHFIPKLYLGFVILDFCISLRDKNSRNSSELTKKAKHFIEENSNDLCNKYNLIIQTTLNKLFIFYQTSRTISLTRYIMKMDTLPQQTSLLKTHLSRIHDKKVITTTLTQSLNYLSGFTQNRSQSENLININQILEQSLFSNCNNSDYLFSVLHYIKSIISELFSDSDMYTAFPILALTPNEIISYSFFERKLRDGSNRLSRIMKANLVSVIIETLNSLHNSILTFKNTEKDTCNDIEFLYKELYIFEETLAMVVHNIFPCKNVEYNYFTWNFVVKKEINSVLKKKQITLSSLKYRIWKYDVHRKLKSKLCNTNLDKVSGFYLSKSLEYVNYFFKWLSTIETFFLLNYNEFYTLIKTFEERVGLADYFSSISSFQRINTIDKIIFQLTRDILGDRRTVNSLNLINIKRIVKLNNPYNVYKLIIELQPVSNPHFTLSMIEIADKNLIKYNYSWTTNSKYKNVKRKFVEENIAFILNIQRLFCTSFIKSFESDHDLWDKWCILIKGWKSTIGILLLLNYLLETKLFYIAKLISQELLFKVLEFNGDARYTEKLIKNIPPGYTFFDKLRKITNFNHFPLVTSINFIILRMQDDYNFQKYNFKILTKEINSKKSHDFENIAMLLNSDAGINEKYTMMDAYIYSQGSLLDINKISVLKTILTSLRLVRDLGLENVQTFMLFSPYLIIRFAIITRNTRLIEILESDIETFLKSEDILLNLIEESLGIVENKHFLIEKIKKSSIFGQADLNMCMQLFPIVERKFELGLNIEDMQSNNTDIYFSIKIISIIHKKKEIGDFLFSISEKISNQLKEILKQSFLYHSLIRPRFECNNSQLWVSEEGSLKTIQDNLHPFSKFLTARSKSCYTNNLQMHIYKSGLNIETHVELNKMNEKNIINISKLRILFRNLTVLLDWGRDNIRMCEFNIATRNLSYLFEIWQRIPEIKSSLKDVVFINDGIIKILISSDKLNLAREVSKHVVESNNKFFEVGFEPGNSNICNLVENSITISRMNLYYNRKNDHVSSISTLNTSRSRNEMIMEIFCNKWGICKEKMIKIENCRNDAIKMLENHILSKPDILDLNILLIVLTYHAWNKLQKHNTRQKNQNLKFPTIFLLRSNILNPISFDLFERIFISNIIITRKAINSLPDLVSNCANLSFGIENNSDLFINSNDSLSLSYITFFLERITNLIKKNIFIRDSHANRIIKCIKVKKSNSIVIYYEQLGFNRKKIFQFDLINHLLIQNIPNHSLVINTFVKFNLWWEAMVYILRWSYELGNSKSRSLLIEKKRGLHVDSEQNLEGLFFDVVLKNAHSANQLNSMINAMNDAVIFGGPRAAIVIKKCKHTIQKYLESNGALEMLYTSFLSLSISNEIPHTIIGAIAIHLSLLSHIDFDSRVGYLESALYHFNNANLILKKRNKSGLSKKNNKQGVHTINYQNPKKTIENPQLSQGLTNIGKLSNVLIPFIADIPIYKMNISPWGGLSLLSIQKIIKLLELQNSIIKILIRYDTCTSILSPNYKDRRDTIINLFLTGEFSLAFKTSNILEIPLMEILVHSTKELIVSYPENNRLSCLLDSMKIWLSEDDSDALISNAVNMWISEKKINLNNISELEKSGVVELINKLSNPISRNEAFNMINYVK